MTRRASGNGEAWFTDNELDRAIAASPLVQEFEELVHLAADLGEQAFDYIEGRGLYHRRLAFAEKLLKSEAEVGRTTA